MNANGKKTNERSSKTGAIVQAGALISAILASACCWLPLFLIAFGISGGALAAKFETFRPVLLPVTFILLGLAFYFTYRKPKDTAALSSGAGEACDTTFGTQEDKDCCCPPDGTRSFTIKKLNRIMLWMVAAFVLAFAFFPNYMGFLMGGSGTAQLQTNADSVEWSMTIEGMTCRLCAEHIQSEFLNVPGVSEAHVDYQQGSAVVIAAQTVNEADLQHAVEAAGYTVSSAEKKTKNQ